MILGPALRYLHVVVAYYQRRQNLAEISRATGIDKASLAAMLVKVRRAAGVRPELKGEVVQVGAMWRHGEEWFDGHVLRKDQRGARKQTHVPAMNNDTLLRKVILSHALRNLEIAERFWIRNQTIVQIAREMGLTYSTVSLRTLQVRRSMESPPERRYRERVYLSRP
ncbi:MAG TPA: hypothetical protein VEB03_01910 [Candidatus Nanoarchaeia archaeon]|nr:hypothetical protein [Candidatus Nanoarchaeia archaeon]